MKVVIMAGGKGTRFWPRSVERKPKQFLSLTSQDTMLQITYGRFRNWLRGESIYVVTTKAYRSLVEEQLPDLPADHIIEEPTPRDTGPCLALTANYFLRSNDDEVIVTAPSDQYIPDDEALMQALWKAEEKAGNDLAIVTLGVVPTRAETGYGYIEAEEGSDGTIRPVRRFIEKPSQKKARKLILLPNIYWNSGIFIWKPSTIAYYMKLYQNSIWEGINLPGDEWKEGYSELPKISIDYAVLEKAETIWTVPVNFEWDDVGLWTSLERIRGKDQFGNMADGRIYFLHSFNNIVYADKQKTAVIGVADLIIVSTEEGLLICHKSNEQLIKKVLEQWEREKESEKK
ncbi:mannose-1-phosphate guanylyltransferase [Paenibacillus sp. J2TS4]|uniref:mannose-1-phosphate guanylyltransferase n=1 Tax=Paenibacillus sp. J2TS4 TaxID=2807194 RepID=UPI001AFF9A64|nr:sugar phosphate nucleotidyltransferase [Paenibacillus sp. J2TS4]GIP31301.1 mannose-1-phosphate guanylyltransferase [Paenibacillus sp. J2TS4]